MKKIVCLILAVLIVITLLAQLACAQVVRLDVQGETAGKATAFCVGSTPDGNGVYLTASHNLRGANRVRIFVEDRWYDASRVNQHPTEDVTSFEAAVRIKPLIVMPEDEQPGTRVRISGYGPEYFGREAGSFGGIVQTGYIDGNNGLHPIPGDSGAPVIAGTDTVVGVISGYDAPYLRTTYRSDWSEQRLKIRYSSSRAIRECLQQCYQSCPPGGCKIWIRQEYRQPIGFLGLPAGPPQRVNIAEPVPRTYVPESQGGCPTPSVIGQAGPPGAPGPPGPEGPAGRSVTREEVESIVNAWLDANRESLVGPRGAQGPPGPAGSAASVAQFESRLTTLEQRPFRIILSSDGKIVDDESYPPGDPVVLDLKRLRSVSDAR